MAFSNHWSNCEKVVSEFRNAYRLTNSDYSESFFYFHEVRDGSVRIFFIGKPNCVESRQRFLTYAKKWEDETELIQSEDMEQLLELYEQSLLAAKENSWEYTFDFEYYCNLFKRVAWAYHLFIMAILRIQSSIREFDEKIYEKLFKTFDLVNKNREMNGKVVIYDMKKKERKNDEDVEDEHETLSVDSLMEINRLVKSDVISYKVMGGKDRSKFFQLRTGNGHYITSSYDEEI